MCLYVPTFHVTRVDLCIIFQCNLYNYILYQIVSNNDIVNIIYIYFHRLLNKWTNRWWLVKRCKHHNRQGKKIRPPILACFHILEHVS